MEENQKKKEEALSTLYDAYSTLRLVGGDKDEDAVGTVLEFARTGRFHVAMECAYMLQQQQVEAMYVLRLYDVQREMMLGLWLL